MKPRYEVVVVGGTAGSTFQMCVRALIGASVVCCRGWEGWDENVGLPQWHQHYHTSVARQTGSNLQRRGFSQLNSQLKQICEENRTQSFYWGGGCKN